MAEPELPGNSHQSKKNQNSKNIEQIATGTKADVKPSMRSRLGEAFAGEDLKSAMGFVLVEVVVPALKDMFVNGVNEAISRVVYGSGSTRVSRGPGHTPYGNMFSSGPSGGTSRTSMTSTQRANHDFSGITLPDRGQAEAVLDRMGDLIERFDICTVEDLYNIVGITATHVDSKWGWATMDGTRPVRLPGGEYSLNLPRPDYLE